MALVVVALLATHEHHTVVAAAQRVADPDGVDAAQTTDRNDARKGAVLDAVHGRHVERRVGVVLARQHQDARLLRELVGDVRRLELVANGVDRVVLERNHAHRTGAHAGAATAATGFVEHRITLLVFVDGAERALHGAALALGATLAPEFREAQVARARMRGATLLGILD